MEDIIAATTNSEDDRTKHLFAAKSALLSYLLALKEENKTKPDPELASEMGPAIVKLYAECRPDELQNYLSDSKEGVSSDVVKDYLTNLERWNALAILYKNNRDYQQSLEIWKNWERVNYHKMLQLILLMIVLNYFRN